MYIYVYYLDIYICMYVYACMYVCMHIFITVFIIISQIRFLLECYTQMCIFDLFQRSVGLCVDNGPNGLMGRYFRMRNAFRSFRLLPYARKHSHLRHELCTSC